MISIHNYYRKIYKVLLVIFSMEGFGTLKKDSVGFWRVAFQGISATAPAAVVSTITAASGYADGSLPLSYLISFVAVLFTLVAIYEYSKKIAHAGGYYAYVSRSSGPFLGIFIGMLVIGYQIADLAFLPLFFVILVEYSISYFTGVIFPTYLWVIIILISIVAWSIPPYMGIKPSLNYSIIFGVAEVAALAILSIAIIIIAGGKNTLTVFTPMYSPTGIHGVFLGGVFALTSFLGYGSVVTLGEEAHEPKETIKKALIVDILIAGAFFLTFSYAYTVGWGSFFDMAGFTNLLIPGTVETERILGLIPALIITFFGLESFFNSSLSFTNAATRYLYAFSRDNHVISNKISFVHKKSGVPRRALLVLVLSYTIIAIIFGEIFGLFLGFEILAAAATIFSLIVHIITNSTVWKLYGKSERKYLYHVLMPGVASALFLYIIYSTVYPFALPLSIAPIIVAAWAIISAVLILRARKIKSENYNNAGQSFTLYEEHI